MGKIATKEATLQLHKLFDFLGDYGGVIKTNQPDSWWNLDLEVELIEGSRKQVFIGIYKEVNGDVVFDPKFDIVLSVEDKVIKEAEIISCSSDGVYGLPSGRIFIDSNDILHAMGTNEKDEVGLVKRFSIFMKNITEIGPYLQEPKEVKNYHQTLAD